MNDLANKFLNAKRALRDTGELSGRTFVDYHAACAEILEHFGSDRLVEDVEGSCRCHERELQVRSCRCHAP